jgi:RNA polymerase sigma-70 factor (sigma-E family)
MTSQGDDREAAFAEFAAGAQASLLRTAVLLTGDRHTAEDLVQSALIRVYLRWGRSDSWDSPVAYARKTLVNLYATWRRRSWHGEVPYAAPGDTGEQGDHAEHVVAHRQVVRALAALPRRQRAVLVLRFFEDMSVEEAAEVLGCSPGTVKSRTGRAIQRLRAANALDHDLEGSTS